MWQILLTFIVMGSVSCQSGICPGFSKYQHQANLLPVKNLIHRGMFSRILKRFSFNNFQMLDGEYVIAETTCDYILNCERISWTTETNEGLTANIIDGDGCCRRISNFTASNPNYFTYDITPQTTCTHLPSTVSVKHKMVGFREDGGNKCYVAYVCHPYRDGLLVVCSEPPVRGLLDSIIELLVGLLRLPLSLLFGLTPAFKTVNQFNCVLDNTCFI